MNMARDGYQVFDSDLHVMEPPDLWQRYIDPAFRDRAPLGLTNLPRTLSVVVEGEVQGVRATDARRDHQIGLTQAHYEEIEKRNYDSGGQLLAMEREGIDCAVMFPSRGLLVVSVPNLEPAFFAAAARAYNDWLHDLCQLAPTRMFGSAMVPATDIQAAISETLRCARDYGFKSIFVTADIYEGRRWDDAYYDPLWSECESLGIAVGFHTTGTPQLRPGQAGGQFHTWMQIHTLTHSIPAMEALVSFTAGGVMERFPKLQVAFLEANCSWSPWLLWRLDEHYELGAFTRTGS